MVAQTPDYIIADCGCPQWDKGKKEIIAFDTLKHFATSMDKNKRLLPQRKTITDYYIQVLSNNFNAWKATEIEDRKMLYQNNRICDDPGIVKHIKTKSNEAIKRERELQQSSCSHTSSSRPHILDKKRSSRTTKTKKIATRVLDIDLDVF